MLTRPGRGLDWHYKDGRGQFFNLSGLDLNTPDLKCDGVYVIWHYDRNGNIVTTWTGQGFIKDRLTEHKREYAGRTRYVAWAEAPRSDDRHGIERFLFNTLNPTDTKRAPSVRPIRVNLPPLLVSNASQES